MIIGHSSDSVELAPAVVTDGESVRASQNIYESLVRHKGISTEAIPGLAKVGDDALGRMFGPAPRPLGDVLPWAGDRSGLGEL